MESIQTQFREESLPLISFNNQSQCNSSSNQQALEFEVNQEVKAILETLKGPIGVITVAGMYRTGKSYLLNRMLLNRSNGFGVGPSINPCTKGLWIWGTPISGFTPEGIPINVLVVDSEGIGGLDEDNNHDMRIFSLALLISSYFIYNSVGSIDENALSQLSLVVNITKHIKMRAVSDSENEGNSDLAEYLPSFMWVVRDFALQLCDEDGAEMSSKEYLEQALIEKGKDSKNEIRKHLKMYFKDRECCTMIRPLTNEDELQNLAEMELEELRGEFVEQVMHLRRKVINRIKPKQFGDTTMDGSIWIALVAQYVEAFNKGSLPNIESAWTYIQKQKAQKMVDECYQQFESEIETLSSSLPSNSEDLKQILKHQKQACLLNFSRMFKGDSEVTNEYNSELQEKVKARCKEIVQESNKKWKLHVTGLLNSLFSDFEYSIKLPLSFDVSQLNLALKEVTSQDRSLENLVQYVKTRVLTAYGIEVKNLQSKYEQELKLVQKDLVEEREKSSELEYSLKDREQYFEQQRQKWVNQEMIFKQQIQTSNDQLKSLESALNTIKKENEKQQDRHKEKEGRLEQYTQQIQELEQQLKESLEAVKQKEHESKKDNAIKDQKIEFLDMQLSECRQQLEDSNRQHEQMVKAMKTDIQLDEDKKKSAKISPEKLENAQQEIAHLTEQFTLDLFQKNQQIDLYQERINELELQLKLQVNDFETEYKELQQQFNDLDQLRHSLQDKLKFVEGNKVKMIDEAEKKYKEAVEKFEDELEQKEQSLQSELKEMQERSEEALTQLRNFYEIEKNKLELRIQEEREKGSRRVKRDQEEMEDRMKEEMTEKEEEIECLQNELNESEQRHQMYVSQMEHELSLKQQMMETLERQIRDSKDMIDSMENGRNNAFEKQIEYFEQQRQEYNQKIDKLQLENLEKDRAFAQLQHKLERLTEEVERKRNDYESLKENYETEKRTNTEKIESTKRKQQEAQDETMRQKLEYGREQALNKQQIEFQQKKIDEMQKLCDDNQRFFDEKIKLYKQEILEDTQASIERITSEKELWENKYEQKRRALKEIEQSLTKSNGDLEKKVTQLMNSNERLEQEKRQMEEQYQDEIENLHQQLQQLDSSAGAAYFYGSAHAEDVIKLKGQVQDLERDLSDMQSTYDRDKALWEGKCQFLETQKETYKRDLIESQKKFEITLEQLQKRGNLDKDKFEINQQALIKVIESKYKNQIKEMMETHQCLQAETQAKTKRLEAEIKVLNEKVHLEARGKLSEYGQLEKRVGDMQENERRLMGELDEIKAERDRRISDYQRQVDKDKEQYRSKLNEYEQKAKDSEGRRAALMFEYEKERAKWQLERDNLLNHKQDLQEQVEKVQQRKDQLLRENEKLKNENKGSRKYLFQNSSNQQSMVTGMQSQMHGNSSSATRYMVGKSVSGQSSNVLSQAISKMKENTQTSSKYTGMMMTEQDQTPSQHSTPKQPKDRYGH